MQPSGGSSPLPASPLPASPYQQTYTPESGLTFTPTPSSAPSTLSTATSTRKKGAPPAVGAVIVIVIVVAALAFSGVFGDLFGSSGTSNTPNVKVSSSSASHSCPYGGTPTETFLFTLLNSDTVNANAAIGFYLNGARVTSGTYGAPAGTSTSYSATAYLSSCPPSGSTYYLTVDSVTAA